MSAQHRPPPHTRHFSKAVCRTRREEDGTGRARRAHHLTTDWIAQTPPFADDQIVPFYLSHINASPILMKVLSRCVGGRSRIEEMQDKLFNNLWASVQLIALFPTSIQCGGGGGRSVGSWSLRSGRQSPTMPPKAAFLSQHLGELLPLGRRRFASMCSVGD
uniref:Uncharacterized protein n=1 Tax=Plectus sambesii TaxID=2011161 RepID=A0A914WTK1_9BILA